MLHFPPLSSCRLSSTIFATGHSFPPGTRHPSRAPRPRKTRHPSRAPSLRAFNQVKLDMYLETEVFEYLCPFRIISHLAEVLTLYLKRSILSHIVNFTFTFTWGFNRYTSNVGGEVLTLYLKRGIVWPSQSHSPEVLIVIPLTREPRF